VHDLGAADAEQDGQYLWTGGLLRELGVEAGAALFDEGEVEAGRVGDRLQMVGRGEVCVAARNGRVLTGG
jgi:hypothetical protein